jgi:hypothetical protein
MRQLRKLDLMLIILALIAAGGLAGWAASVAVEYFEGDLNVDGTSPSQQGTVEPE